MLRIHFTAADLGRVQVAAGQDPLWETTLGLQQLTAGPRGAAAFRTWRRQANTAVEERHLGREVRLLRTVVPNSGYYPDFLTPPEALDGLAAGLDAIRGTPSERLRGELGRLAAGPAVRRSARSWLRSLADGDRESMAELTGALRAVHQAVIAPEWSRAEVLVEVDRARRARALRDGGVPGLLASLGPAFRWEPPVLCMDYPVDRDLWLAGRGLRLVPSYFCWRTPIALADPGLQPVLAYPVDRDTRTSAQQADPQALPALLGRTRARTLAALREAATTGELARRLRVSPASASQHVHVLTAAHLVHSQRLGNQVLHSLTPLGAALLTGRQPASLARS
ncbi:ArsR/SmtB family transcription factor [Kitasatospora viridis]|uniref:ArsR/SmtB family transcription factor n=1 Tax=Kitasatospora viridis TaxID=281105 RepID=UPI0011A76002|nr:DUF5937 family protein [Kitasatospora viridis]